MKGIDVAIVRLLPLVLYIDNVVYIIRAWDGYKDEVAALFHSNSVIYAAALFFISLSNKKYHCIWNRAMYVELIVIPLVNYLDAKFGIFPTTEGLLIVTSSTWIITFIITTYLAVRHFMKKRIKKNESRRFIADNAGGTKDA